MPKEHSGKSSCLEDPNCGLFGKAWRGTARAELPQAPVPTLLWCRPAGQAWCLPARVHVLRVPLSSLRTALQGWSSTWELASCHAHCCFAEAKVRRLQLVTCK